MGHRIGVLLFASVATLLAASAAFAQAQKERTLDEIKTEAIKRAENGMYPLIGLDPADVKAIRARLGKSQTEFAQMIGVSAATLQNWEQGRRTPDGPALALLRVASAEPRAVARALQGAAY